jgi:uncharacterized protein YktA (UPF0223 family)
MLLPNMQSKINTKEAIEYISSWYTKKGYEQSLGDWELTKKYKNFKGETCRDVSNHKNRIRCVLVNAENGDISIIEGENYEYFLKLVIDKPMFYYIPTVSNDGLVFVFEGASYFDRFNSFAISQQQNKIILKKKLLKFFREQDIFEVSDQMNFAFPNEEMDNVVRKLEKNQITFNKKLATCLNLEKYQPIIIDVGLSSYRFPLDEDLNQEESINIIFSLMSRPKSLTEEDIARIKLLLKKIKSDEYNIVKKIALGFKRNVEQKVIDMFEAEENRKKAQQLVKNVWLHKNGY